MDQEMPINDAPSQFSQITKGERNMKKQKRG